MSELMLTPTLEKLLVLQDRDSKRLALEAQLKAVPEDIAAVERKIAAEKAAIEAAKAELMELEAKKKMLETEIGSAESKVAKYKTQQLQVRKNDEYRALGQEIEHTEAAISALEEQELEVMYAIDEAKKKFAEAEAVLKGNIAGHEQKIRTLKERAVNLTSELKAAEAEVAVAREPIEERVLRVYDRIAARQQPVCAAVRGTTCSGCHLKVSAEVESAVRGKGDAMGGLPTCDQCGRIVWWDAA